MILKGSQRAGGKALAHHLMRTDENDHIDVHEIRGFVGNKLIDAFHEAYAISRGTKCKQFLFSLSLSPPSDKVVSVKAFERAIGTIEARLGLAGQPRAIVFHEKNGRRHAHCVWSRIDPRTMRARQMGHFKLKLVELSRELYLEHGWTLPGGLNREQKRRDNFSLAEGQQAKRIGRDPARLKQIFKDCWDSSDSSHSFQLALKQRAIAWPEATEEAMWPSMPTVRSTRCRDGAACRRSNWRNALPRCPLFPPSPRFYRVRKKPSSARRARLHPRSCQSQRKCARLK